MICINANPNKPEKLIKYLFKDYKFIYLNAPKEEY